MTIRVKTDPQVWDPYLSENLANGEQMYMDKLWVPNWTTDPSVNPFQIGFCPDQYQVGQMAQSWEMTNPTTLTVHLRHGVKWQNIPAGKRPRVCSF